MSEMINNREYRQKILKELIYELHEGASVDDVKARFEELIKGISPTEITEMEQALIMKGLPVDHIQKLCDVHASVFKGSIEEIHRSKKPEEISGHPIYTFRLENEAIEKLINDKIKVEISNFKENGIKDSNKLSSIIKLLEEINKHYSKKENLLFPLMEKYGITAPPQVMWGVDDEIRDGIKEIKNLLVNNDNDYEIIINKLEEVTNQITEMIFKEEKILFPMVLDTLTEDEWMEVVEASDEIGYCLIEKPEMLWKPSNENVEEKSIKEGEIPSNDGYVKFDAGILLPKEINAIMNTLPVDITFVDKEGTVKYFSQGKERIFARPKTIIGRKVENCHPPASVHIVEKIVEDLKSGKKDHEDFWIKMGDKYVFIRYFAVRDKDNEFLGVLELTQDIKPIQEITGEKRLVEE